MRAGRQALATRTLLAAAFTWASTSMPTLAQQRPASAAEVESLKAEVQRLRSDVEVMKTHIGRIARYLDDRDRRNVQAPPPVPAPAAPVPLDLADAPSLGRKDAPVTLVEFSDYECPFCQRHFLSVLPEIKREYVDTGKVRYVFVDFPLEQLHPHARKAAEAAYCAGEQGRYWEMHDALFTNQQALELPQLGGHARNLGLDATAFENCLFSGRHAARVARHAGMGASAGINATPTFIAGRSDGNRLASMNMIVGSQPIEAYRRALDDLLGATR